MLEFIRRNNTTNIDETAKALYKETGYPLSLCRLLCMRKINTKTAADEYLSPSFSQLYDSFLFDDMKKAAERIVLAKKRSEKVCIYGDYDVDGICATSILYLYFKHIGLDVSYYIPSRQDEGYGMNVYAIETIHSQGVTLIVSVDNGITAINETAHAKRLGIDVIVTDHHKCGDTLPDCYAIICHTRENETYPNKAICGSGTALKLVHALGGDEAAKQYMPYAALATVADVVELSGENRAIVALALKQINSGICPIGMKALINASITGERLVNERDFAFGLSPRLNAAGRMDSASIGVELMCSDNMQKAAELASKLNELNTLRREGEELILSEAYEQISKIDLTKAKILVLKSDKWNPGIVGIAAAKIAETYYRPTILLAQKDDILVGSARSIPEVNIYDAMAEFSDMYIKFGGHSYAAGVTLAAESFDKYATAINDYITKSYDWKCFIPKCVYDDEIEPYAINSELIQTLDRLSPFGEGNPKPVLLTRSIRFADIKRIGQQLNHLSGKIIKSGKLFDFIAFNRGYLFEDLLDCDMCDIAYTPIINEWGNSKRIQLRLSELCATSITNVTEHFEMRSEKFINSLCKNIIESKGSDISNIRRCDCDSEIEKIIESSFDGTLILCTTKQGAIEFSGKYIEKFDSSFYMPQKSSINCNSVVFAPVISKLSEFSESYKKIIVYDYISKPMLSSLCSMFKDSQIIVPISIKACNEADMIISELDRTGMGIVYKAIIKSLDNKSCYNDILIKKVNELTGKRKCICEVAMQVFVELDLILCDNNGSIYQNTTKTVSLDDSYIYTSMKSLITDIESLNLLINS